ncbi:hypothetical protein JMJ35_006181 [Cladonia borealis]|uniref:Uncharacterized protein n=1 Tax=Cladonia borealis TaxID=184061 RepID=A0AA39QYP7_9LECA|nr:hypothetical protein JMJ35_006181 [Cladonia borealis]
MDHLPVPQNPVRPKIEVPYFCQIPYDGKYFKGFPQRCGFELDEKGCVRPKGSHRAMLGFYQTWLYFGLIVEFFRYPVENRDLPPIEMEDFIRPSDAGGSPIICSVKLTDMINIWGRNYYGFKYYGFKMPFARKPSPTMESLLDSVKHALLECVYLDQVHVVGTWQIKGAYEVILSVKILLNSFLTALNCESSTKSWAPPMEKVKSFLNEGGIPLITCSRVSPGNLALDVVKATQGVKYTAISHVWADGLGNTLDNSIPDCQLRRLFKSLKALHIGKTENSWLHFSKLSAIARMTPTYNGAVNVLMLDSDLVETSSHGTPIEEISARVVKSAWQGRYWTLQEGLLAPKLFVQTYDRAFCTADRWRMVNSRKSTGYDHKVIVASIRDATDRAAVGHGYSEWRVSEEILKKIDGDRDRQFIQVWNDLLGRSTTKFEDVHCILANLLDFKAAEILRLPPNSRMKAMLCAQERLPLNLICGQSPRIESDDGSDRWVPAYPGGLPIEWNSNERDRDSDFVHVTRNKDLIYYPSDRVKIIRLDAGVPRLPRFCVETEGEEKWWIYTHNDHIAPVINESINYSTCLIMNACNGDIRSHGYCGSGARLSMARQDDPSNNRIRAKFDCSFSFGLWSWGQTDPAFEDVPVVTGICLPGHSILIETEMLAQSQNLTRRVGHGATGPETGPVVDKLSGVITVVGIFLMIFDGITGHDHIMMMLYCITILFGVVLFLSNKERKKKFYNNWRMSFADEQMSTDNQNHWFPPFSRYNPFSWWKKLRQGPWNTLKRRRDTGVAGIPLEPILSNIDESPGPST